MSMLDGLDLGICCVHRNCDWALIANVEREELLYG
jgi:hypothetical protein